MPTISPQRVELPEKIQEQINVANTKIALLKEDEIAIARQKVEIEKEVARLSITKDTLESSLPQLEKDVTKAQEELDAVLAKKGQAETDLNELGQSIKTANKALKEATDQTQDQVTKREEILSAIRKEQKELQEQKEQLDKDVLSFNQRRDRVKELLASV